MAAKTAVCYRLDEDERAMLAQMAADEGRSVGNMMGQLIRRAARQHSARAMVDGDWEPRGKSDKAEQAGKGKA